MEQQNYMTSEREVEVKSVPINRHIPRLQNKQDIEQIQTEHIEKTNAMFKMIELIELLKVGGVK